MDIFFILQSPGGSKWKDVKHFFLPRVFTFKTWRSFVLMLKRQPSSYSIAPYLMETAIKFFKSTCLFKRHNDEGTIHPFVHWILHAAAASMNSEIYHVVNEPCVFPPNEDWLSDLAVMETQCICIMQHHVMKVLVETKGTGGFPRNLQNVKIGQKKYKLKASGDMSQLFQQVALAYASGLWQNSLLCGLVTSNEWHFFVVESTSSRQQPF